ncbi:TPA: PAS domain S-box protein, partial [Candidatus Bipolaricaulota bacterium]|nr:PAS domain S-box protein [Candidatus Bipolaricaulota bacterium]
LEEIKLLKDIGFQLGLALEQVGLHQQLDISYQRLQAAYKIGQLISGSLDPEEVLEQLVRTAVEELDFEVGYLTTYSEEERALRVRTIYPRDERLAQALKVLGIEELEDYAFPIMPEFEPILKRWFAGEPVLTDSYYELVLPDIPKEAAEAVQKLYGVRKLIELPLRAKERFIGTLLLATKHPQIDGELFQLLRAIANQAAIALENARLYQEAIELGNKYQSLVENELIGIYIIQDGKLKYLNEGLCKSLGYTKEELLSSDPIRLVHPEDREMILQNVEKRLRGEPLTGSYTFRGLRKDGRVVELEVFARLIEYGGRPAIQGVLVDITLLREAERLRRGLLDVAEKILASYDIEHIL